MSKVILQDDFQIKQEGGPDLKFREERPTETASERKAAFEKLIPKIMEDAVVDELNAKHAVVHTDQFYILTEKPHPLFGGKDFTLESKQSFINTYENQKVICSDGQTRSKAKIWLAHAKRRYFDGIVFDPKAEGHSNGLYNIWKGFAIKPKEGSCELFKMHMKDVICGGNEGYYFYVWRWIAHLIQTPQKLSPGIVLMGEQGIGKNTFSDTLGVIFGQHYLPLDNIEQFLGHFNFHLKNAVLIHGNEAVWGGDRRLLGKLKAMITEESCVIEGKGKDQLPMRNFKHLILSSNEDWPVHLDRDDRRFLALKISSKYKGDRSYFKALHEELGSGGREALLFELLEENLAQFDVWEIPENFEAFEIKMISASSSEKYIYEVLKEGSFDIGSVTQSREWLSASDSYSISTNKVFIDYKNWCADQGKKHADESILGKALARLTLCTKIRKRDSGDRVQHYLFPALKNARAKFQKEYKVGGGIWS